MCVSSRSSLVLFLSGFIGSLALLYKNGDPNNLFMLFLIVVQLAEYLMWIDIENEGKYPNLNILGNYICIVALFLQTSGLILLMPKQYGLLIVIPNFIFITIIAMIYTKKLMNDKKSALTTVGKTNTLVWSLIPNIPVLNWIGLVLYIIANVYINTLYFERYSGSLLNLFLVAISFKLVHSFRAEYYSSVYCYVGAIATLSYVIFKLFR